MCIRKRKTVTELDLKGYIYLQLFCRFFNHFNGTFFIVGFCLVVVGTPVALSYLSLKYFDQLGIKLQLLFPLAAVFCVILIVTLVPQDAKVRIDSVRYLVNARKKRVEFLRWRQDDVKIFGQPLMDRESHMEFIHKRLDAFSPLGIEIWFFGHFSISTSQNMIDQMFNNILLLLSL